MIKIEGYAHCDGPCGVYDPASARIAGEAVLSMTKKMLDLECPDTSNSSMMASYLNTMSRYAAVKEEQAQLCKVLCSHPYQKNKKIVKRITKIESDDLVCIRGDNPIFSTDSRSYGPISKSKIIAIKTEK